MTDQELLQAMSQMMDQKLEPIKAEITEMKEDIAEMKEDLEEVREATNYTAEWIEKLEKAFQDHVVKGENK